MVENTYPYIEPMAHPTPVYMHLTDIDGVGSFFVFMHAAIRCYPFVLVASFALSFFLIFIITNRKILYHKILYSYSNYLCNKNVYNKGGE